MTCMLGGVQRFFLMVSVLAAALALTASASARTWYVDDDSGYAGTGCGTSDGSSSNKFPKIQLAATCAAPGDIVEISSGTYRETVRPARNGTSASPIVYKAASSATVIVTGANLVTGWTADGSNYRASVDCTPDGLPGIKTSAGGFIPYGYSQVFKTVNGSTTTMMTDARWPDDTAADPLQFVKNLYFGWAETVTSTTVVDPAGGPYSTNLANAPSGTYDFSTYGNPFIWVNGSGPDAGGTNLHYTAYTGKVTAWSSGTSTVTVSGGFSGENGYGPGPYYLFGTLPLLNRTDEWVQRDGNLWLNHNPTTASPVETIEFKCRRWAFDLLDRSWITVKKDSGTSFQITGAGIRISGPNGASNNVLDSLKIRWPDYKIGHPWGELGRQGVVIIGNKNTLQNSTIDWAALNGVYLNGFGNTIKNNLITNVGYAGTWHFAGILVEGSDNLITQNTVKNTEYAGIYVIGARRTRISYNDVSNTMLLSDDGGGIYAPFIDGDNVEIDHNRIHDTTGNGVFQWANIGLYIDIGAGSVIAHHNAIWDNGGTATNGHEVFLGKPKDFLLFYNNTVVTDSNQFDIGSNNNRLYGSRFINNIFYGNSSLPFTSTHDSPTASNNLYSATNPQWVNQGADDFHLTCATSPAKDAGTTVAYVTDGYGGANPDAGAYECSPTAGSASADWDAGCRSPNIDSTTCTASIAPLNLSAGQTPYRNVIKRSGFEELAADSLPPYARYVIPPGMTTNPLDPWYVQSGSPVFFRDVAFCYGCDTTHMAGGIGSLRLGSGVSELREVVPVTSSVSYTLRAWVKVVAASGQSATVSVTAGTSASQTVDGSSTGCWQGTPTPCWKQVQFSITPSSTSATVAISSTSGSDYVYVDNVSFYSSQSGNAGTTPSAPTTPSPSNGATSVASNPTLSWTGSSTANFYQVTVDDSSDFSSPVINVNTTSTSYAVPNGTLCRSTLYSWKVTAFNYTAGSGTSSSTWTFTTGTWSNPTPGAYCNYTATAGYSSTQGSHQWRYEYLNGSSYSDLTYEASSGWWRLAGAYPIVGSGWQHPYNDQDSSLTWVAPANGYVTITSAAITISDVNSDGVIAYVLRNDDPPASAIWSATVTPSASVTPPTLKVAVNSGDKIHFRLNKNGTHFSDSTNWNPVVELTPALTYTAQAGFSDLQYKNNWIYAYVTPGANDDTWMSIYDTTNSYWRYASGSFPLIGSGLLHPGDTKDAVLAWEAPNIGTVTLTADSNVASVDGGSDGIDVTIRAAQPDWSLTTLWSYAISGGGSVAQPTITYPVLPTWLMYRANKHGNHYSDSLSWTPRVVFWPTLSEISSWYFTYAQKQTQWRYEYSTGTTYTEMPYFDFTNGYWRYAANDFPVVGGGWQHPGSTYDSTLTWIAPAAGTVSIASTVVSIGAGGDGVVAYILKNSQATSAPIWSASIAAGGYAVHPERTVGVAAGDKIRFRVNRNSTITSDSTSWDPTIRFLPANVGSSTG